MARWDMTKLSSITFKGAMFPFELLVAYKDIHVVLKFFFFLGMQSQEELLDFLIKTPPRANVHLLPLTQ